MLKYLIAATPFHARLFSNGQPRWLTEVERLTELDADYRATHLGEAERIRRFAQDLAGYLARLGSPAEPVGIMLAAPPALLPSARHYLEGSPGCRILTMLGQDLTRASVRTIVAVAREALIDTRQPTERPDRHAAKVTPTFRVAAGAQSTDPTSAKRALN